MSPELRAYLDGLPVGTFTQTSQGALGFRYDDDRDSARRTLLSWSMPFERSQHGNRVVRAWLDGLLPDNQMVRERWARQYAVSANNPFALLRHVGRDAAGAVQILPPGTASEDAAERRGDVEWLDDAEVVAMLGELAEHRYDWDPGRQAGRWSLAGAQSKMALHRDPTARRWGIPRDSTPTTHILKPVIPGLDDHHINEVLCLKAARRLGLAAAAVDVMESGAVQAMVSVRYDRVMGPDGVYHRLHQEDLCQALAVHPSLKYQSEGGPGIGQIADLLATFDLRDREAARGRFFDGVAYNVLIGGTDAHAKNYSLLLAGRRAQFAPLYDVASAAPYEFDTPAAAAMKVGDHWAMRQITDSDWAKAGRRLGLRADAAVGRVRALRDRIPEAFAQAVGDLPDSMRGRALAIAAAVERHVDGLPRA